MKRVTEISEATESRGEMRNGRLESVSMWQVVICTLECGHKEKRTKGVTSPTKLKCKICEKKK